jgi:hypothetical protein
MKPTHNTVNFTASPRRGDEGRYALGVYPQLDIAHLAARLDPLDPEHDRQGRGGPAILMTIEGNRHRAVLVGIDLDPGEVLAPQDYVIDGTAAPDHDFGPRRVVVGVGLDQESAGILLGPIIEPASRSRVIQIDFGIGRVNWWLVGALVGVFR